MDHIANKTTRDGHHWYDFVCPACGEAGELGIGVNQTGQIACPADCGASFLQWINKGRATLTCVVCPVFADNAP